MPNQRTKLFSLRKKKHVNTPAPDLLTGHAAFSVFDKDGSGALDTEEIRAILQRPGGGSPLSDEEVAEIIEAFVSCSNPGRAVFPRVRCNIMS